MSEYPKSTITGAAPTLAEGTYDVREFIREVARLQANAPIVDRDPGDEDASP